MTYSDRTRELAAQMLSMAASNGKWLGDAAYWRRCRSDNRAWLLAQAALSHASTYCVVRCQYVSPYDVTAEFREGYAEAEALIRTGWLP